MNFASRSVVVLMALALSALACCHPAGSLARSASAQDEALTALTIQNGDVVHSFRAEVARTIAEQERGLMYRTSLPVDGGMLFPFDPPRPASFWMRNTPLSLDLIFIRPDGRIGRIAARAVPQSLALIESGGPVIAVLEIAGGGAARRGLSEGDRVQWRGGPR